MQRLSATGGTPTDISGDTVAVEPSGVGHAGAYAHQMTLTTWRKSATLGIKKARFADDPTKVRKYS